MPKRIRSILINPLFLTAILFVLQLGLFLWITMRPFSVAPPGRNYYVLNGEGAYAAHIRQAEDGPVWKLYNPYTTRPNPAVYVHVFYVIVGKIAHLFSFDPVSAYMVTRVAAGLILFFATYVFIVTVLPADLQSLAVLFTLGLEPGPLISAIKNIPSILDAVPAIFSYFPQELALRHFGLPHHVLSEAFGLFLLTAVFLYIKKASWPRLVGIALLTITGALLMPAYDSMLVLTVFVAWFLWALFRGQIKKILPPLLTIVISLGAVGIFTKLQMDTSYAFKNFNIDEKRWVTDPFLLTNYLSSLLLYLPAILALFLALPHMWRKMGVSVQLLVVLGTTWILGPLFYIPLTHLTIFPFANFRLMDGYDYVPAGILAALGILAIGRVLNKSAAKIVVICMIAASLFLTFSFTRQTFANQEQIWTNVYPQNLEWDAIRFLSTVPHQSGVMVMQYFGEIIPSYATVRVFLGETPGFLDWNERYHEATQFYSGQLTTADAKTLLHRENISYVYWGADEKKFFNTPIFYPAILTPVFQNPAVTIFAIKK